MRDFINIYIPDFIKKTENNNQLVLHANQVRPDMSKLVLYYNQKVYFTDLGFTERYCNLIQDRIYEGSILDIFSGNGIIGLRFSDNNYKIDCADYSPDAVDLINLNINVNNLQSTVSSIHSDCFDNITHSYDYITAVPPMANSSHCDQMLPSYVPRIAYDAGEDNLYFYKKFLTDGVECLNTGGRIFLPIYIKQFDELKQFTGDKNLSITMKLHLTDINQRPHGLLEVYKK